jgi:hypothetical protein
MQHNSCSVCGEPLLYKKEAHLHKCYHCGSETKTNVFCTNNHFVCDECSRRDVYEIIINECIKYTGTAPFELAGKILNSPKLWIHGPEHHLIVPCVMLTVYLNHKNRQEEKAERLKDAKTRALKVHDGICATHGTCGGAMGVGMFFSIILDVNELQDKNYAYINQATANTLLNVARYGGPRCCKRSTFFGLLQIRNQLADDFNIVLPIPEKIQCSFVAQNKECTKQNCLFF